MEYEYEPFSLTYNVPSKDHKYTPDFVLPNGIILEGKGICDPETRKKMLLVIEQHPHLDIRMLFMRDQPIYKNAKQRYSDWCEKKGIKYAISYDGAIPEEWLDEVNLEEELIKDDNN